MSARLVTLLMIGLLILGIAGQSWAQLTRTYSNPMNFSNNQPSEQNFQIPHYSPNALGPANGQDINKKATNLWGAGNFSSGVEVQVTPMFGSPWGLTPFGPSRPDH
ncbi:MAG TPA: hypothetical protein VIN67_11885 [Desulfobaccales bacterium]